ncbi:MAG: hypothetical protein B6245_03180 [Desulfobacteraceae bacterium 4572_88]|nr:MAG: hypothetical protein B6245_03180 [Desulfobacteraceae bacterium 4572_88]
MRRIKKLLVICIAIILMADMLIPKGAYCISIGEEETLSHEFMKMVLKNYKLIKDPIIAGYVEDIGQKLVSTLPPQPFTYHFYVIREDAYNAFAAPAGHIFINSGLFEAMEDESELAGILAHEIAHSVCRHISQKIERSSKIGLLTLAGLVAGILLGVGGGSGAAANALSVGSAAAGQSLSLAYSREDERQADQLGVKYLSAAGYNLQGLTLILKKIRNKQWYGSDQIPTYLMTHPAVEERIVYLSDYSKKADGEEKKVCREFQKAHNRLIAVYGDKDMALKRFEAEVHKQPENAMTHYGYGLILARTGNRRDAIVHLKKALEDNAFDPYVLADIGQTYFLDGRYQEAIRALEGAVSIESENPDGLFFLGRTQMKLENFEAATRTFEKLLEKHQDDKRAFYFLGEAYGKQNKLGDAHYYLGRHYKEKRDLKNAMFHLRKALAHTTDPEKKLRIEEMLKETKEKAEKMQKEMRKKEHGLRQLQGLTIRKGFFSSPSYSQSL